MSLAWALRGAERSGLLGFEDARPGVALGGVGGVPWRQDARRGSTRALRPVSAPALPAMAARAHLSPGSA